MSRKAKFSRTSTRTRPTNTCSASGASSKRREPLAHRRSPDLAGHFPKTPAETGTPAGAISRPTLSTGGLGHILAIAYRSIPPCVSRPSAWQRSAALAELLPVIVLAVCTATARSAERPVTFERDVEPILTRAGCNAGACHGKARGQNGFAAVAARLRPRFRLRRHRPGGPRPARLPGRRRSTACCCARPTAQVPHGGGKRLDGRRSDLRDAAPLDRRRHAARRPQDAPVLRAHHRRAGRAHPGQQRRAAAASSPPTTPTARPPTSRTWRRSSRTRASSPRSTPDGLVKAGPLPGEAAIMARFMEKFAVCNVVIPLPGSVPAERLRPAAAQQLHRRPGLGQAPAARHHAVGRRPAMPRSCAGRIST